MPKITFKVREKVWKLLNDECKALSLKRDDFLDRVIDIELDNFEKITKCDDVGSAWLEKNWIYYNTPFACQYYDVIPVSVNLSESLIKSIQAISTDKKVPRDAFLDLAIQFVSIRILEPAKIIKNPRIDTDIYSRTIRVLGDDDIDLLSDDAIEDILSVNKEWLAKNRRLISLMENNIYAKLSITQADVEQQRNIQEAFNE